ARRGCNRAEMTTGIYDNSDTCWNGCPTDPGNKRGCVRVDLSNSNCVGLVSNTRAVNIDIVTACGQMFARLKAQCDVVVAGCVVRERLITCGRVAAASGIAIERIKTRCGVPVARCVAKQCKRTVGRVEAACRVVVERLL